MKLALVAVALMTAPASLAAERRPLIPHEEVLGQWRKAENRGSCAPLAFARDGGQGGTSRRAYFGGGWGVAFDRPGLRSAYGLAGTGHLPEDDEPFTVQRERLAAQWPYARALPKLRPGAFAGYGLEGAKPLAAGDGDGRGQNMLAYVRVPGQRCLYNVWSRLGRVHLETLLDSLRVIPVRR